MLDHTGVDRAQNLVLDKADMGGAGKARALGFQGGARDFAALRHGLREDRDRRLAELLRPAAMRLGRDGDARVDRGAVDQRLHRQVQARAGPSGAGAGVLGGNGTLHVHAVSSSACLTAIASQMAAATSGPPSALNGAYAGGRGHVDLGEPAVDHVNADEDQTPPLQFGSDGRADFLFARRKLGGFRRAAAHHVGADVIGRRHAIDAAARLAVDQDDPLVAAADGGQEFLHHPLLAEAGRKKVEQRAVIGVLNEQPKHRGAAVPMQGFHHHFAVFGAKGVDRRALAGDEGRRHQLRIIHHEQLFRRIAHAGGIVDDEGLAADLFQQMGRGDIGEVKGRILAQQHHVHVAQVDFARLAKLVVLALDVAHLQRLRRGHDVDAAQREPVGGVIEYLESTRLRFEQQGKGRIPGYVDAFDRVHLDGDPGDAAHCRSFVQEIRLSRISIFL